MAERIIEIKPGEAVEISRGPQSGPWKRRKTTIGADTRVVIPALTEPPPPPPTPSPAWTEDFSAGLGSFAAQTVNWPTTGQAFDPAHVEVVSGILRIRADFNPQRGGFVLGPVFDHGYFEARIKFPQGNGLWPAFWLQRPFSAPAPWDEVDFMEAYPNTTVWPGQNSFQTTVHTYPGGALSSKQLNVDTGSTLAGAWHIYGALLVPGQRVDTYLDGVLKGSITQGVPALQDFHIVLSHLVGNWSAQPDATTPNPAYMEVDWVRWYEQKPTSGLL